MTRIFTIVFAGLILSMNATGRSVDRIKISHIAGEIDIHSLDDPKWFDGTEVRIATYWSGEKAPMQRAFSVRLLWSSTALYVRFEAEQHEPLIVSDKPVTTQKVMGLWDRDVCEIFIAPDNKVRTRYYEFEVAPTGEWIDLGISATPKKRVTDLEYSSGLTASARIDTNKVIMALKIPFSAFGSTPRPGDIWLGNVFRCVGKGPDRGYLSWRPTKTKKPAFHVPAAFGEFEFVN